jgi:hypothetical protein
MSALAPPSEPRLDPEAARVDQLAREILHEDHRAYDAEGIELVEHAGDGVSVTVVLKRRRPASDAGAVDSDVVNVTGKGVGLVDAFFNGVMLAWAEEFSSLKTIHISDFSVGTGFDGAQGRRSDALAHAILRLKNAHDVEYTFERQTASITRSCVQVVLDAVTFFINAERAYLQLQLALKDAAERRRSDLVARYREQLSTLVLATSYAEISEKFHKAE